MHTHRARVLRALHCALCHGCDCDRRKGCSPGSRSPDHPNGGVFCLKCKAAPELVYHPDRSTYERDADSRAIATFYAPFGNFDEPGGNVIFPKAPLNAVAGKEFLSKETALQRIGRKRKPLGPPAKPGNCAAYDIFTAVLEGRPYPVKALLNFGSNTIMSTGDSQRAREAFRAVDFAVAAELFMTPTAELCDYVLPATSFLEMSNLSNDFKHRQQSRLHVQYRSVVVD